MTQLENVRPLGTVARQRPGKRLQTYSAPLRYRQQLYAELAAMSRRGEIANAVGWEEGGMVCVQVERIRDTRSRTPWYIAAVTTALGVVVGVGVLLYQSRYVLMAAAGVALLVLGAIRLLGGHSGACMGIHCSGCSGCKG
jgi:hypothetical protein